MLGRFSESSESTDPQPQQPDRVEVCPERCQLLNLSLNRQVFRLLLRRGLAKVSLDHPLPVFRPRRLPSRLRERVPAAVTDASRTSLLIFAACATLAEPGAAVAARIPAFPAEAAILRPAALQGTFSMSAASVIRAETATAAQTVRLSQCHRTAVESLPRPKNPGHGYQKSKSPEPFGPGLFDFIVIGSGGRI